MGCCLFTVFVFYVNMQTDSMIDLQMTGVFIMSLWCWCLSLMFSNTHSPSSVRMVCECRIMRACASPFLSEMENEHQSLTALTSLVKESPLRKLLANHPSLLKDFTRTNPGVDTSEIHIIEYSWRQHYKIITIDQIKMMPCETDLRNDGADDVWWRLSVMKRESNETAFSHRDDSVDLWRILMFR